MHSLTIFYVSIAYVLIGRAFSMSEECLKEWNKILANVNSSVYLDSQDDYSKMYQYSGFSINDLGDYYACNAIEIASYALLYYNNAPIILQGLCSPSVCT